MLDYTKCILKINKGTTKGLSGLLYFQINEIKTKLYSLMMPIHAGHLARFEQVKKKVDQEVKSFEEELKQIVRDSRGRIILETRIISDRIEKHVQSTKKQMKRYIKKTEDLNSYLLRRGDLIHSISTYLLETLSISNKLSRVGYPKGRINQSYIVKHDVPFVREYIPQLKEFTNKLYSLLYDKDYTLYFLQDRIKKLIYFLNDVLHLHEPTEIIKGNRSFDFQEGTGRRYDKELEQIRGSILKLVDLEEKIGKLRRKIGSLGFFEAFFKEIAELKSRMKPIRGYILPSLASFIDNLDYIRTTKENMINFLKGMESRIQKTIKKLHNAQKIIKFLQAVELRLITLRGVPEPELENIGKHISKLNDWMVSAKATFRIVNSSFRINIGQVLQIDRHDEIRSGPVKIKQYIDKVVPELIQHVNSEISTLQSIKSIYEQLKKIKEIVKEQDEAMNEIQKARHTLESSSLEKIKPIIEKFVKIKSNIDKISECFGKKRRELKPIENNVNKLKLLILDLWKLQFSIYNDIGFAKTIEKIVKDFESLKTEAEKEFKKVESLIVYLIRNIKSIIETLGSICRIRESICCKKSGLTDLRNLKPNLDDLKIYLERLSEYINATDELLVGLKGSIPILKKYLDIIVMKASEIKCLELKIRRLRFIEHLPELLFMPLRLEYMEKCHPFFDEINSSIKCAIDTIENCRFVLGIKIIDIMVGEIRSDSPLKK